MVTKFKIVWYLLIIIKNHVVLKKNYNFLFYIFTISELKKLQFCA